MPLQASMQSELEIATAEMERAQQRLMSLEREKEALVAQVSQILTYLHFLWLIASMKGPLGGPKWGLCAQSAHCW